MCLQLFSGFCLFYECFECNRRCCWAGSQDSSGWPDADAKEVKEIYHHCGRVLGAYAVKVDDLVVVVRGFEPDFQKDLVVTLVRPPPSAALEGAPPPFYLCLDHKRREVALYIRGLNLGQTSDYKLLMGNRAGEQLYGGGTVHFGFHKAAQWLITNVLPKIKELIEAHPGYRLTLVGHSLGAGVAAVFTLLLAQQPELLDNLVERSRLRCFALATPRSMSHKLAAEYSDVIYSVIYQDDFLARTSTMSAQHVLTAAVACTGIILCYYFCDQCWSSRSHENEKDYAPDPHALVPPGRIFHVVYKKPGSCKGQQQLVVRTAVPSAASDPFQRLVVSCSSTTHDHSVLSLAEHLKTYVAPSVPTTAPQVQQITAREDVIKPTLPASGSTGDVS
eukprot:TRINITY_DN32357_c0_g1_i1.p1 TRINITY_DN32357_c0_g1~~TRINITY_DN32357_c0_g1_i1.p1  ORF type:complete len:390 (+),score=78.01 TRINITY_DN32357_c0_g1_i1:837-2006(+)